MPLGRSRGFIGPIQSFSITYGQDYTDWGTTGDYLPTTEPATPQVYFDCDAAIIPVLTGVAVLNWRPMVRVSVYNPGVVTTTIYWRVKRNGSSIGTGSNSSSNIYGNLYLIYDTSAAQFASGDNVEVALWASNADTIRISAATITGLVASVNIWIPGRGGIQPIQIDKSTYLSNPGLADPATGAVSSYSQVYMAVTRTAAAAQNFIIPQNQYNSTLEAFAAGMVRPRLPIPLVSEYAASRGISSSSSNRYYTSGYLFAGLRYRIVG